MSIRNSLHTQEYLYDFAVDGGAIGDIDLHAKENYSPLPIGAVVKAVYAKVLTTVTGGAGATIAWGNEDDEDGYSGPTVAIAGATANAVFNGWDNASVLLWDDANKHQIFITIDDADAAQFVFQIATATLTAGRILFVVEYYMPSV